MKNKRTFVGLFVILALLCLGIGYAAISKTLVIHGGIQTGDTSQLSGNFIVYFSKVEVDTTLAEGATVIANVDPAIKTANTTFTIQNMNKVGSKVVLTYTVQNDSEDLYADGPTIHFGGQQVSANEKISVGEVPQADPEFTVTVTPNIVNHMGISGQASPKTSHTITIVVEMTNSPLVQTSHSFELCLIYDANTIPYSG